jgi:soluble lytic murein transglycosylase
MFPLFLAGLIAAAGAGDVAQASPAAPEPHVLVGPALRTLALPLSADALEALRLREWDGAVAALRAMDGEVLTGAERGAHAFLLAWSLVHAGRGKEATAQLALATGAPDVPESYLDLLRGEVARAQGDLLMALDHLERVRDHAVVWPRAMVQRAEVLRELGRTGDGYAVYEELAERADPVAGNPEALLALAARQGAGSPKAYPLLRRVVTHYPRTQYSIEAARMLAAYPDASEYRATWQEVGLRAERLMARGEYGAAVAETGQRIGELSGNNVDSCRVLYTRGRSYYKLNQLSNAVSAFSDAGERCVGVEGAYGPRALYLQATAQSRRGQHRAAAELNRALADRYPEHSMADDGLTRGGIALQEAGDLEGARRLWLRALKEFPGGDTAPEATWRLAFSYYLGGRPADARQIGEELGGLPPDGDAVSVAAGRYWSARWRLYPDVDQPRIADPDPNARAEAVAGWRTLCEEMPHSFYSILAYSRLVEVAPDVAQALAKRPADRDTGDVARPWVVRLDMAEDPSVVDGVALARLGLIQEARAEWSDLDEDTLRPDEKAWLTELRISTGDWLLAHDDLRRWGRSHPPGALGPRQAQVLRVAYPDRYWDIVQAEAGDYSFEPRLFHALVREESNFNRRIVSFAGARGLSQLMPATARQTAGWLKMSITMDDLNDPATNLRIGGRYLAAMHKQHDGNPYLALAAYNAGSGRVSQWIARFGNVPLDEYVEQIPFRETRGYVKRVMGTWQTMRYQFDDGSPFPDLSAFNHQALPGS